MPRMRITMMSLMRCPTIAMIMSTAAEPAQAAPAMPMAENAADMPSSGAPRMKSATPRLAPELMPST